MRLRQTTEADLLAINQGIRLLRQARDRFKTAGARKAAEYVRKAIKSGEGARRHAERASMRELAAYIANYEKDREGSI